MVAGGCTWLPGGMPGCQGVHRIRRDTVLLECILVSLVFQELKLLTKADKAT